MVPGRNGAQAHLRLRRMVSATTVSIVVVSGHQRRIATKVPCASSAAPAMRLFAAP